MTGDAEISCLTEQLMSLILLNDRGQAHHYTDAGPDDLISMFSCQDIKELEEFRAKNQRLQKVKEATHQQHTVVFLQCGLS